MSAESKKAVRGRKRKRMTPFNGEWLVIYIEARHRAELLLYLKHFLVRLNKGDFTHELVNHMGMASLGMGNAHRQDDSIDLNQLMLSIYEAKPTYLHRHKAGDKRGILNYIKQNQRQAEFVDGAMQYSVDTEPVTI